MFKKVPRVGQAMQDFFVERFPTIFIIMINMLKNLPQTGTMQIRKDLLGHVRNILNDVAALERQDINADRQGARIVRI
jgi:hypothetical protein